MKKEYLTIPGLLALLAAQGADFDRAQLDRMLSQLERSTPPTELSPGAMCYSPVPVRIESKRTEYICPVCGKRTFYPSQQYLTLLKSARDGVKKLRRLGLDIALDETVFCWKCAADPKSFRRQTCPFSAVIATAADPKEVKLPAGTRVNIEEQYADGRCLISVADLFVSRELIDEQGKLLKNANLRVGSGTDDPSVGVFQAGRCFPLQSPLPGDSPEWVRVAPPEEFRQITVEPGALTDIKAREIAFPAAQNLSLVPTWEISVGDSVRRIPYEDEDIEIMEAFLTGKDTVRGSRDSETALKNKLPRLRQLFGNAVQP